MRIPLDASAPLWGQQLARGTERAIEEQIWPFVSRDVYTITTLPTASTKPFRLAFVSNGAGNKFVVVSNGTAWYYLEGTAV